MNLVGCCGAFIGYNIGFDTEPCDTPKTIQGTDVDTRQFYPREQTVAQVKQK